MTGTSCGRSARARSTSVTAWARGKAELPPLDFDACKAVEVTT
jgi:hypothetical protein